MARSTIVDQVTEQIAFRVASGSYAPGTKLPSVRNLATEYGINPSTVQVVLAHLQSAGFVEAHHGVGVIVRDIQLYGGIETWRYLFRFSQQLPELAVKMLQDVLATRLSIVVEATRAVSKDPARVDSTAVSHAIDQLELLAATTPDDIAAMAQVELHALRLILTGVGQGLGRAMFNSVGEMMVEQPDVIAAMYDNVDPEIKVVAWRTLLASWRSGELTDEVIANLDTMLRAWDVRTLQRYREILDQRR